MEEKNISDRSSGRFWLRTDCVQPSDCLFWRGVIFRKGWGLLRTPTGEGPARSDGVQQGTDTSRESGLVLPVLIHKS